MKPIFIPLKTEFYEAFISGTKKYEYRKYGGYWSEKHIWPGKEVVISKGYGKHNRRKGVVTSFQKTMGYNCPNPQSVKQIYGTTDIEIAEIGIELV